MNAASGASGFSGKCEPKTLPPSPRNLGAIASFSTFAVSTGESSTGITCWECQPFRTVAVLAARTFLTQLTSPNVENR